jgi:phosphoribosylglycinamide formyltransferase 1
MAGRIVVLISGAGSNMEALVDACERDEVPGRVVAVIADRDCEGVRLAEKRGIGSEVVDFTSFTSRDEWSAALRDRVQAFSPDLVVSAGFMRILAPVFVESFGGRLINLHPALLPSFAGAHGVRDALEHGVKVTGTTVHFVDNLVDHGPILLQEAVEVRPDDDVDTLHERIKAAEHRLLPKACRLILEGKVVVEGTRVRVDE